MQPQPDKLPAALSFQSTYSAPGRLNQSTSSNRSHRRLIGPDQGCWRPGPVATSQHCQRPGHGHTHPALPDQTNVPPAAARQGLFGVSSGCCFPCSCSCLHVLKAQSMLWVCSQNVLEMSKDAFREQFGDTPRKDDLTILVPRQDDPTEQVGSACIQEAKSVCSSHRLPLFMLSVDICVLPRGNQSRCQDNQGACARVCVS